MNDYPVTQYEIDQDRIDRANAAAYAKRQAVHQYQAERTRLDAHDAARLAQQNRSDAAAQAAQAMLPALEVMVQAILEHSLTLLAMIQPLTLDLDTEVIADEYYQHTAEDGTTVLCGHRAIADAQRAQEDAEGGLVARLCQGQR